MGVRIEFEEGEYLKGLDDIVDKIQQEADKLEHKTTQGLADALLYVAEESQQRAPVDTGDLRGSVLVELDGEEYATGAENGGVNVAGTLPERATKGSVSYNTPYAATQHEQIHYDHPRGGQAKYLESVLIEEQDRILKIIAEKITEE